METKRKQLATAIVEFLQTSCTDGSVKGDDVESLGVAVQCIAEAFGLGADEAEWSKYSVRPATLSSIFDVYLNTVAKKQQREGEKENTSATQENTNISAEEYKTQGNKKLVEKKYEEAIALYTKAIEADPSNAVYYANRAAAYSCSGKHQEAVNDCRQSLTVDPDYAKAYSRLGLAQYSLGNYSDAVDAYQNALRLDPTNEAAKQALQTAQQKQQSKQKAPETETTKSPLGGGAGGFDFASLLSNPQLMNMASEVLKNPQAAQMLQGLMGGAPSAGGSSSAANSNSDAGAAGGGLASLLNNPNIMNAAQQFMSDPKMREMMEKRK